MNPVTSNNKVETTLVLNVVSAPIPVNVGHATDRQITVVSTGTFDILFSDDGTSNFAGPVSTAQPFLARTPYTFDLGPKNTHYKVIGVAGTFRHWLSSKT